MEEESDGVFCLGKSKGCQDDKSLPPGFRGDESAFSNCTSPLILSKWRNKPSDSDGRWTITLQFRAPADGQRPLCPEHLGLLRATTCSGDIAGLAVTSSRCVKVAASVCLSRKLSHFEKLSHKRRRNNEASRRPGWHTGFAEAARWSEPQEEGRNDGVWKLFDSQIGWCCSKQSRHLQSRLSAASHPKL